MAHIPYGYVIANGKAAADRAQQEKLTVLYRHILSGATIADAAAAADTGRTTKCCAAMLVNRIYLGTAFYPRLVGDALFARVQEEMKRRRAALAGRGGRRKRVPVRVQTRFRYEGCVPAEPDAVYIYEIGNCETRSANSQF